jgi:hypothetical protein
MRRLKNTPDRIAGRQSSAPSVAPVHPTGVYGREQARAILGLPDSTFRLECQSGRLRSSRRGKRLYFLGQWLIDWVSATPASER